MNYERAWKSVKKTLQICLLLNDSGHVGLSVNDAGLVKFDDAGADKMAKAIISMMESYEKKIEEEKE